MSSRRKSLTTSLELDRLSTTPQRRSSISKDDAHADIVSVLPESDDRLETVAFLNEEEADDLPMPAIASTKPTTISRGTVFYIVLNCAATVAVVFLNKITFSDDQLKHCQFSTTTYHFLTTFVLLYLASSPPGPIATWYKPIFAIRWLPIRSILPICILFASFLVLGNFSLTYNSVSFFQLAKILTVPTVVLLNFLLFRKTISLMKMCAVGVACIGVAVATGASVQGNMLGTSIAVASFVCTALYQIYIGKTLGTPIDGKDVSAPQLLMNQTLISSAMLVCLIPFFDRTPNFGMTSSAICFCTKHDANAS